MPFWKRRLARPRVNVYDSETQQIHSIPADELAPGMVRVRFEGRAEDVWVDASRLTKGEYRHPPFDEQGRDLIRQIKGALDEVYFMTEDAWEDGFRRDTHVEREIGIWLRIAHVFQQLTESADLNIDEKRKVLEILLSCANNPRDQVFQVVDSHPLAQEDAERAAKAFYGD